MAEARIRLLISGRVQGVGFRAFVAHRARAEGLHGFVRNLRDRRVEAVLEGEADKVELVRRACEQGPPGSHVASVEIASSTDEDVAFPFEVRRDR